MTDTSDLAAAISRLNGVDVLCIGDVMLDRFVYGSVERISPEGPIPVLRVVRETAMLGGAGNVVRNLVSLGGKPHFLAVVGNDSAGREISRLVGDHAAVDPALVVEIDRPTTIKTRFIAAGQQLLRSDQETAAPLEPASHQQILEHAQRLYAETSVVVLSDYGKGVLTPPVLRQIISSATAAGKPVIIDPKGTDYRIYAGAYLVTPNRKELHDATKMPADSDEAVVAAARFLIEHCQIENVLVTRSQDGMTLVEGNGAVCHLPAEAREVFDVSGAGDTVVATLAAALAAGVSLPQAAHLSNIAAGIVVAKVGTAVTYQSELLLALHESDPEDNAGKVMPAELAAEQLQRWRHKGQRIGFTNGCFDLLHPGHISLLTQARAQCDRLVVGLNSDASVQRLKGPTRPVQSEQSRATVLAALACVDLVVIFEEDTPLSLICQLRPDLLVKGSDYTVETVVGAREVSSWGGRVFLADLIAGQSTTGTIARMAVKDKL